MKKNSKSSQSSVPYGLYLLKSEGKSKLVKKTEIALKAWQIWMAQGCPDGQEVQHWLQAEHELIEG